MGEREISYYKYGQTEAYLMLGIYQKLRVA